MMHGTTNIKFMSIRVGHEARLNSISHTVRIKPLVCTFLCINQVCLM